MNRNLGIERVYSLGDYKSIRFLDFINEVPEEIAMNMDAVGLIRYLQLVGVDLAYTKYNMLLKQHTPMLEHERESFLTTEYANTMDELKQLINSIKGE
jgi:hypothetical protein